MSHDGNRFGGLLRAGRRSAGLSQEELAARSQVSVRALRNLEAGHTRWPYRGTVLRLADALELRDAVRAEFIGAADRRLVSVPVAAGIPLAGNGSRDTDRRQLVPRQLPASVRPFVGREAELAELNRLLERGGAGAPAAVVISAIEGTPGVGKTALAVHWAHLVAERFPDGQIYLNLRGFDPSGKPVPPAVAIRDILASLDIPADRIPATPEAQAALYRSLLASKRMLVVLDNARDAQQVRPLLPGGPDCLVVVTSRSQMTGLVATEGAHALTLDLLTETEARQLLELRLGADRVGAEPATAAELVQLCSRLPLALAIAAARLSARPRFGLKLFAEELKEARSRLDALEVEGDSASVRMVFSWSLGGLSAQAAGMFGLLGLHPGPDITGQDAACLAGISRPLASAALRELARASLVTEHSPGRYTLHDLLRAYAAEVALEQYSAEGRQTAIHRVLDYYLHTAHSADALIYPGRTQLALPAPRPDVLPGEFADVQQAESWLLSEHEILMAAIDKAMELRFYTHVWQITQCVSRFLHVKGRRYEWVSILLTALRAADYLADTSAQARLHVTFAYACTELGETQEALYHLRLASSHYRQLGDRSGEAHVQLAYCVTHRNEGRYEAAFEHAQYAVILYQFAGRRSGQAIALDLMGFSYAHLGMPLHALACSRLALELHRTAGHKHGEADTWDSLGYAGYLLGEYGEAAYCYQAALILYSAHAMSIQEAYTRVRLGDASLAAGDLAKAHAEWKRALTILDEADHPGADRLQPRLHFVEAMLEGRVGDRTDPADVPVFESFDFG